MLTPELQKITKAYEKTMLEVRGRISLIKSILKGEASIGVDDINHEIIAMNFRKVAELIVFANLIGHETEYTTLYPNVADEWNMGRLINRIKAINPKYYPVAWAPIETKPNALDLVKRKEEDAMTEADLIDMYGRCSDLIHAHNPLKGELDYFPYVVLFDEWLRKLFGLLNIHGVMLSNNKNLVVCALSSVTNNEKPEAIIYEVNHDKQQLILLS